jgi:transposase
MDVEPPIDAELWERIPGEAKDALLRVFADLAARISRLEQTVAEQKAELERLRKNSRNSSFPPSSDKPEFKRARPKKKRGRKKGGQKGHNKHQRRLVPVKDVNKIKVCKPVLCGRCEASLPDEDDPEFERHQVWEVPPVEPHVTEYQVHTIECARCGGRTRGELPEGVGRGCFGPCLTALVGLLTGVCRLSKRSIARLMAEVFNLEISTGQVCRLQAQLADALDPSVQEVTEHVREQPASIDETGWKEKAKRFWLWVAVAPGAVLFLIRRHRSAAVLHEIVGSDYAHVVTSDRAKAYDTLPLQQRQLCWAHLDRDFQAMIDRDNRGSRVGQRLSKAVDCLFDWWHKVRDGTWSRKTFQRKLPALRAEFKSAFEFGRGCACPKTAAACRELLAREKALWTFAYVEGVEPTNNEGEREIRHPVTYRKLCYGTHSEQGSKFVANIMTVVGTLRRQGRATLPFLTACCDAFRKGTPPPSPFDPATLDAHA